MTLRVAIVAALLAVPAASQQAASQGSGAVLRTLDKITGDLQDITIENGGHAGVWRMSIDLGECRYPAGNPAGDAYAYLTIRLREEADPAFAGWMIASSPALSAMDDARYDVWVLRCTTS